jgi:hypothetical protein
MKNKDLFFLFISMGRFGVNAFQRLRIAGGKTAAMVEIISRVGLEITGQS